MRRLHTSAALALVVLGLAVFTQAPVSAGGPTSVLITDQSQGRATGLSYADSSYAALEELLNEGETVAKPSESALGDRVYHLTWLIHDVTPWRVDDVFVDARGGPVVATRFTEPGGPVDEEVLWRRLDSGAALVRALDQSLGGKAPAAFEPAASDAAPTERVVTRTSTEWYSLSGSRWLVPGAALGLVGGLLLARRRDQAERRVLVDHEPERAGVS